MSFPIQDWGANGGFPSTVGGTGTSVKYFGRNAAFAAGATWTSPATPSSTNASGLMVVPGDLKLNGQVLEVVASGAFFPSSAISSSETVTVALYAVTGTITSPTYTQLASTGAFAPGVDGLWYNFTIRANMQGNNDSGIVGGNYSAVVNNTVANSTPKALDSALSVGASHHFSMRCRAGTQPSSWPQRAARDIMITSSLARPRSAAE